MRSQAYSSIPIRDAVAFGVSVQEMGAEGEPELLGRDDALLLGEGEGGVLLRVGGQHVALIAGDVGRR